MIKELVIISGKGGTGKTSITTALCSLIQNKIMVDCDVDASDMHLILKPQILSSNEFHCGKIAKINKNKCIDCKKCEQVCKFNAIKNNEVNSFYCEGCGACYFQCPANAIEFENTKSGDWFESNTRFGKLIHAKLGAGEENSGKLVSEIRNYARLLAYKEKKKLIVVDGSPGIGCPVIASISGASVVLIVTEPTMSGLHDLKRVLELTKHFGIKAMVCINKFDINLEITKEINTFCEKNNIEVISQIKYDNVFMKAMIEEKTITEYNPDCEISKEINLMWDKIRGKLNEQ